MEGMDIKEKEESRVCIYCRSLTKFGKSKYGNFPDYQDKFGHYLWFDKIYLNKKDLITIWRKE